MSKRHCGSIALGAVTLSFGAYLLNSFMNSDSNFAVGLIDGCI